MKLPFLNTLIPPLSSIFLTGLCLSGGYAQAGCTFSGTTNGTFAAPALQQGWLEAASAISGAGASATTTVNCGATPSQISSATITPISTPLGFDSAAANERAIIRYDPTSKFLNVGDAGFTPGAGTWGLANSLDFNLPTNTNATLDISLTIGFNDTRVLPAGSYQYSVTLTATPQ
ncbi:hypothetical protein PN441_07685 [Spirulina major CS-329]|uniref:hypothetical protein n=1 Tax=Spirulina TaxID=1154 RepID=UPI0023303819|nr:MULTISPECIES: hypothetical protein [Spirulina]MDB9495044.1 hypothetical protein [Spirulina subsalsa CS-330]MDB9502950.1 hypothetical protein [Spirulina major CS-329]